MNNTNRVLNRLGILLLGLLLLVVGGAVAAASAFPDTVAAWATGANTGAKPGAGFGGLVGGALRGTSDVARQLDTALSGGSSELLAVAGVAALLIVLLLWFITRQGHGQAATLLTRGGGTAGGDTGAGGGAVIVSSSLAARSITQALGEYSGVTQVGVGAFRVRGATALKITVSARRGVSPRDIRDRVDTIVRRFDEMLGADVPVFISITGGFASRRAKATRLAGPGSEHRPA